MAGLAVTDQPKSERAFRHRQKVRQRCFEFQVSSVPPKSNMECTKGSNHPCGLNLATLPAVYGKFAHAGVCREG
jgi:hypothetical protein